MSYSPSNPAPYRSATPVSHRVDIAWHRGYEAGRAEGRRLAVIGLLVAVVTLWRHPVVRGHAHLLPWAIVVSMMLAVVVVMAIPFALTGFGIRTGIRRHRRRLARAQAMAPVDPGDSSKEWEPF